MTIPPYSPQRRGDSGEQLPSRLRPPRKKSIITKLPDYTVSPETQTHEKKEVDQVNIAAQEAMEALTKILEDTQKPSRAQAGQINIRPANATLRSPRTVATPRSPSTGQLKERRGVTIQPPRTPTQSGEVVRTAQADKVENVLPPSKIPRPKTPSRRSEPPASPPALSGPRNVLFPSKIPHPKTPSRQSKPSSPPALTSPSIQSRARESTSSLTTMTPEDTVQPTSTTSSNKPQGQNRPPANAREEELSSLTPLQSSELAMQDSTSLPTLLSKQENVTAMDNAGQSLQVVTSPASPVSASEALSEKGYESARSGDSEELSPLSKPPLSLEDEVSTIPTSTDSPISILSSESSDTISTTPLPEQEGVQEASSSPSQQLQEGISAITPTSTLSPIPNDKEAIISLSMKFQFEENIQNIKKIKLEINNMHNKISSKLNNDIKRNESEATKIKTKIKTLTEQNTQINAQQLNSKERMQKIQGDINEKRFLLKNNGIDNYKIEDVQTAIKSYEVALQGLEDANQVYEDVNINYNQNHDLLKNTRDNYEEAQKAFKETQESHENTRKDLDLKKLQEQLKQFEQDIEILKQLEEGYTQELRSAQKTLESAESAVTQAKKISEEIVKLLDLNQELTKLEQEQALQTETMQQNQEEINQAYFTAQTVAQNILQLERYENSRKNLHSKLEKLEKATKALEKPHESFQILEQKILKRTNELASLEEEYKKVRELFQEKQKEQEKEQEMEEIELQRFLKEFEDNEDPED